MIALIDETSTLKYIDSSKQSVKLPFEDIKKFQINGELLVCNLKENKIVLYNLTTNHLLFEFFYEKDKYRVSFRLTDSLLYILVNNKLDVYSLDEYVLINSISLERQISNFVLSPDCSVCVVYSLHEICIYDVATWELFRRIDSDKFYSDVSFIDSENIIFYSRSYNFINKCNIVTGEIYFKFKVNNSFAFDKKMIYNPRNNSVAIKIFNGVRILFLDTMFFFDYTFYRDEHLKDFMFVEDKLILLFNSGSVIFLNSKTLSKVDEINDENYVCISS